MAYALLLFCFARQFVNLTADGTREIRSYQINESNPVILFEKS